MKLSFTFSPEAQVTPVYAPDGKTIVGFDAIPLFTSPKSNASVLYVAAVTAKNTVIDRSIILASGATGRILKRSQGKLPIVPLIDA